MKTVIALALLLIVSSTTVNATIHTLKTGPETLAKVNNWHIPAKSFDVYYRYQAEQDETLTRDALLYNLILNRLLSQYALEEVGKQTLNDDPKVAYNSETALRDLLTAIIRFSFNEQINQSIESTKKQSLSSYITQAFALTKSQLQAIISPPKQSFLLVYKLSEQQSLLASNTQLLQFKFPGEALSHVTLLDIYQASNVQEKIAMHQHDIAKLKELIQRHMTALYAQYWLKTLSGLSKIEIQALKDFIAQNRTSGQYYRYAGFKAGIHDDNPRLKEVANAVKFNEVQTYYQNNKEDFKTILKIKARHISLDSQTLADKVQAELKAGLSFAKAIELYSTASDKQLPIPGDLGWINRSGNNAWLQSLPFTQKKGHYSPAFMSPIQPGEKHYWEIVYVDEVIEGFYPVVSETVKYQASRQIAEQKIHQHVVSLRSQLINKASLFIPENLKSRFSDEQKTLEVIDIFHQAHDHDHD